MLSNQLFKLEEKLALLSQRQKETDLIVDKIVLLRKKLKSNFGANAIDVIWKDVQECNLVFSWCYQCGSLAFSLMRFQDGSTYLDYKEVGKDTMTVLDILEKKINARISQKTIRIN